VSRAPVNRAIFSFLPSDNIITTTENDENDNGQDTTDTTAAIGNKTENNEATRKQLHGSRNKPRKRRRRGWNTENETSEITSCLDTLDQKIYFMILLHFEIIPEWPTRSPNAYGKRTLTLIASTIEMQLKRAVRISDLNKY
jgi:hypothetical protein